VILTTEDILVNLKMPGNVTQDLVFTIYVNGTGPNSEIVFTDTLTPIDCGTDANLWYVDLETTLAAGSYTLEINYDSTGKNFSSDSFIVVAP
jgi:hypothetical protein